MIGEMAGSHGVKRPGGSALNAGQTGGLRAAEYIANAYGANVPTYAKQQKEIDEQLTSLVTKLNGWKKSSGPAAKTVIEEIQNRMTTSGGHIREMADATKALKEAMALYEAIRANGVKLAGRKSVVPAIQAEHLALASVGYLKAVVELRPGIEANAETTKPIMAFCRDNLARQKHPRSIAYTTEMPRDPSGKLFKRKLRDPYWEGRPRAI